MGNQGPNAHFQSTIQAYRTKKTRIFSHKYNNIEGIEMILLKQLFTLLSVKYGDIKRNGGKSTLVTEQH